jgi:glycosyltransferase involved in cell wall biosynthesis
MHTPRVSVVIPAFNEEKLLRRCIESLQDQSVPAHEIIVVDNNSTDKTASIAESLGVTVISEPSQGIAWARDAGFNHASGDIIARLDADCIAPAHWIETITKHYQDRDIATSTGITGMGYYTTRSRLLGKTAGTIIVGSYHLLSRPMLGGNPLFGSCMAFPRSWWEPIKATVCRDSEAIHEDVDLAAHLLMQGYRIEKLPNFYTYIDSRSLHESPKKTLWRLKIWPEVVRRHRKQLRAAK